MGAQGAHPSHSTDSTGPRPHVPPDEAPLWFVQDGETLGCFLPFGRGRKRAAGAGPDPNLQQPTRELVHPDDLAGWEQWVARLRSAGAAAPLRARIRRRNGAFCTFEWSGLGVPDRQLAFGIGQPLIESASTRGGSIAYEDVLDVDVTSRWARVKGEPLALTRTEFDLLVLLLESRGRVVTTDAIAHDLWHYEQAGNRNFLQAHVSRLRNKLRDAGLPEVIETVRGVGYVIR